MVEYRSFEMSPSQRGVGSGRDLQGTRRREDLADQGYLGGSNDGVEICLQDAKVCFVTLGRGFEAEACTGLLAGLMGGHAVQGDVEEEIGEVFRPGRQSKLIAAGE